ncbi:metalloprotease MEP1 [Metarhizium guizhouense ARSEF 977]|uniref:Metalloprotease MEP1 n=1 Tax=Metarhizium guizhouense (strain ARSEF 977) TaxID=1276136 RepID=A0A0B4GF50_METGA|nr:metalloprotease MEP1 [Metarhizium guizhouense ARSEF 977]
MLHSLAISSLVALTTALAVDKPLDVCGTPPPSEGLVDAVKEIRLQEQELSTQGLVAQANVVVDTYIHIISSDGTPQGGNVSDDIVRRQMDVLNQGLSGTGFSVTLRGVDRTVNAAWANDRNEVAMKRELRKGSYKDLNLYYLNAPQGSASIGGYCYFPVQGARPGSESFIRDGCVMQFGSMPGGSLGSNNLGKVTVHEVGHWFGLFHTFQGGCEASSGGDLVDDTPAHAAPRTASDYQCPAGSNIDTCPSLPGLDPLHNYMSYRQDRCYTEFTRGQISRMVSLWRYRDPSAGFSTASIN